MKKIVAALLNTVQQDGRSLPPDRLAAVTSYAQQTEAETFNTAASQEDYFHRLAERIYKIQKDYEEKQMTKKQQQILTTTLTSIDKSAGEQGPPNRIAPQSEFPSPFASNNTQIKIEPMSNHHSNTTPAAPFDTHRVSTDSLNRMTIHSNNPSHTDTNGNHADSTQVKTEQISPNRETKVQVSIEGTEWKQDHRQWNF